MLGHVVTLLSGLAIPLDRFCAVLGNTFGIVVHDAEFVLGGA